MYKTVLIFIKIHVSQGPGYKGITESGQLPGENFPAEQYGDPFIRLVSKYMHCMGFTGPHNQEISLFKLDIVPLHPHMTISGYKIIELKPVMKMGLI
jgi:hypothetical protein